MRYIHISALLPYKALVVWWHITTIVDGIMHTHIYMYPYVFLLKCCHLLNWSSISSQYHMSQCFLATKSVKILLRNSSGKKDRGEGRMRIHPKPSFCATHEPCGSSAMNAATYGEIVVAVSRLVRN